jgi:hypothetical protein
MISKNNPVLASLFMSATILKHMLRIQCSYQRPQSPQRFNALEPLKL